MIANFVIVRAYFQSLADLILRIKVFVVLFIPSADQPCRQVGPRSL